MKRFVVLFESRVRHELAIDAEDPREAVRLAQARVKADPPACSPTWYAEAVEPQDEEDPDAAAGFEVAGSCEVCGVVLLYGDDSVPFVGTEDGSVCLGCAVKAPAGPAPEDPAADDEADEALTW